MKKIVSMALAAVIALSVAALLGGCGNQEYPVQIANYTIDKEPQNVVVLDAATADIMSYIGYDRKFAGRSDAVNQESLAAAPIVGSSTNPDVDVIEKLGADLVFAGEELTRGAKEKLEEKNIPVIKLQQPQSSAEVKTNYETIGKILGGKVTGLKEGADAYEKLVGELDKQKRNIEGLSGTGALSTIAYLYLDNGQLKQLTNGSYGNILMGYTNCVNVAVNVDQNLVDPITLSGANPTFVFYDNADTLKAITDDKTLAKLDAIKNKRAMQISLASMSRPGATAVETLKTMIDFIYNGKAATPDSAAVSATVAPTAASAATVAATAAAQPATTVPATAQPAAKADESVADKYEVKLDGLSLKKQDENDNVEIMQQRLYDLGYVDDKENITGYFGDVTEQAVKDFQKKNGIEETGTADNATLTAMFKASAKKA